MSTPAPAPVPPGVALLLHTHMPYVEGYGTWPSGEEWLWEAVATSYLPLLDVLDAGAPLTLSLTPVLCDQLRAPAALDRCRAFLDGIRVVSHAADAASAREDGDTAVALELERAAGDYSQASARLAGDAADMVGRLAPHAAWTSSATHAVLPLLATDAGIRLQVRSGIDAHRARFGDWAGGFWAPECAYGPVLAPLLASEGVKAVCVELTDVFGPGDPRHLRPIRAPDGPLLVPIDRALVDLVWGPRGYPASAAYRDSHRRTANHHHPWANDGAVYDPERADAQARQDAADLAERCARRIADGGLCVLAFDTELFGHWWHEGPAFLAAFVDEAIRAGLPLQHLDHVVAHADGVAEPVAARATTSWGEPHTLWTWSGPQVSDIVIAQRAAELAVVDAGADVPVRAVRELLALQASDWAFMVTRELSGPYPRERHEGHRVELQRALDSVALPDAAVRDLAAHVSIDALLEP